MSYRKLSGILNILIGLFFLIFIAGKIILQLIALIIGVLLIFRGVSLFYLAPLSFTRTCSFFSRMNFRK